MSALASTAQSKMHMVQFLQKYSELLGLHLQSVRYEMETMVDKMMYDLKSLSETTAEGRSEAEKVLEETYLSPDQETLDLVNSIQAAVDSILDQAQTEQASESEIDSESLQSAWKQVSYTSVDQALRRFASKFSKNIEALSSIDGDIRDALMKMVGALSNEDVIGQRINHLIQLVHALHIGLEYILLDFENRFTLNNVRKLREELLSYTAGVLTSKDERYLFEGLFPEEKSARRA